ncbi:hypothetical protein AMS57_02135 [Pseudoalteromonas undina]|uniref:hypothetical protein n=1 Tax=Pseudoalteromonas undina TaxID=43660 RepID=UPI0006BB0208|nr:hypothetical protein [Pseudoalteromonas undina]KPH92345.1 hypothetical protein AMS57_02135 [Pseudoalteromonas undina]
MFIRKFLKPNQVDEVNAKGSFIKVMNCEGVFRIRVLSQGRAIVDTDAAAGFDIQTKEPFDFIEITSDIEQKLQLWASEHKLSYDALSVKASRVNSSLVKHYGHNQMISGYDPAQSRVIVQSDKDWFIGGAGVSASDGIPVAANERYIHDSAAPVYSFLDEQPIPIYSADFSSPEIYDFNAFTLDSDSIRKLDERYFYVSNMGVYDTVEKSVKSLDTGWIDANTIGAPFIHDGIFYMMFQSFNRGFEIYYGRDDGESIVFYGAAVSAQGVPDLTAALGETQRNQVSGYSDGLVYLVGSTNTVVKLDFNVVDTSAVGLEVQTINAQVENIAFDTHVKSVFVAAKQNVVFYVCSNKVLVFDLGFASVDSFNLNVDVMDCEPSFYDGTWIFQALANNESSYFEYSVQNGYKPAMFSEWLVGLLGDGGVVTYSDDGIYANGEMVFDTFNVGVNKNRPICFLEMGTGVYIVELAAGNMLCFNNEILGYEELAQFRVLKESF